MIIWGSFFLILLIQKSFPVFLLNPVCLAFLNWRVNCLVAQSPHSLRSRLPPFICSTFHNVILCPTLPSSCCVSECHLLPSPVPLEILALSCCMLSQNSFLAAQANTRSVCVSEVPNTPLHFFFWVFFFLNFDIWYFFQKLHLVFVLNAWILLDYFLECFW